MPLALQTVLKNKSDPLYIEAETIPINHSGHAVFPGELVFHSGQCKEY